MASLIIFLFIFIFIESLIFYKYTIDTGITIKGLKVDRDTYRNSLWNFMKGIDRERKMVKETNAQQNNLAYINLKKTIKTLHDDILDTDFDTHENVKDDILSALKEIDSYGN
jgi:hypothetical protein